MASANLKISEKDCKSKKYLEINVNKDLASKLIRRYYLDPDTKKLKLVENEKNILDKKIKFRSPLWCKSETGICEICYGKLAEQLQNNNIGIIAGGYSASKLLI